MLDVFFLKYKQVPIILGFSMDLDKHRNHCVRVMCGHANNQSSRFKVQIKDIHTHPEQVFYQNNTVNRIFCRPLHMSLLINFLRQTEVEFFILFCLKRAFFSSQSNHNLSGAYC